MQSISRAFDALNEKIGVYSSYLILPLVGVVVYEVLMRYVFGAPTSWGFEMTISGSSIAGPPHAPSKSPPHIENPRPNS